MLTFILLVFPFNNLHINQKPISVQKVRYEKSIHSARYRDRIAKYLSNWYTNNISDKGAVVIGSNETWKELKMLSLHENQIGDQGAVAIANNTT